MELRYNYCKIYLSFRIVIPSGFDRDDGFHQPAPATGVEVSKTDRRLQGASASTARSKASTSIWLTGTPIPP